MVWLVDEHSDEESNKPRRVSESERALPRHAPPTLPHFARSLPQSRSVFRKTPPTLKIHSCVAQPAIAPKYCGAQFLQHAAKLGFFKNAPPAGGYLLCASSRLGALQMILFAFCCNAIFFFGCPSFSSCGLRSALLNGCREALPDRE